MRNAHRAARAALAAVIIVVAALAASTWMEKEAAAPALGSETELDRRVEASPRDAPLAAEWLEDDLVGPPIELERLPVSVDPRAPARRALPLGPAAPEARGPAQGVPSAGLAVEEWRVDNGRPQLRVNLQAGPTHGFANRFDPSDLADRGDGPPRPVRLRKIHFLVNGTGEPTGSMEWHVWEDNGGHKADVGRDIVPPVTVTGGPGENVIDLDALGIEVTVDPPRMFHVGVANKSSEADSPDVLLDDGLPFVGGSGDFHASVSGTAIGANPANMHCGVEEWILLSAQLQGETSPRSPAWMVWLEVEWLDAPESLLFERIGGPDAPAGDFGGGSRIAWGDYDGDGYEDVLESGSRLYRNLGDGTFVDVTAAAGITDTGSGGIWGDYDNDGDLDFYQYTPNCVPCQNPSADNYDDLWRNNGDGTFTNVRAADYGGDPDAPVPRDPLPTEGAAWGDFNGDGYLDLYVANHVDWDAADTCFDDYLWLNEGPPAYGFRDVSREAGIRVVKLCGRGVSPGDFDGDGDTDVFVSNYRLNRNLLWVNTGNDENGVPRFVNEAAKRGVEGVAKTGRFAGSYGHTIGAVWGDLDHDGDQDLVAANLAHSAWLCFSDRTMVYASSGWAGGYTFDDTREESGVRYVETHSDPSLADVDNDGFLDLHFTHVYDGWRSSLYRNVSGEAPPTPAPHRAAFLPSLLRGSSARGTAASGTVASAAAADDGPAIRFAEVTHVSGMYPRTGWGSAWSDLDLDGDLDLAARGLWRNRADENGNRWLQVVAIGCGGSNRDALGAKVGVRVVSASGAGEREMWSEIVGARGTGSQDSRVQHFGLGPDGTVTLARVIFPGGASGALADVGHNRRITITQVGAYIRPSAWRVPFGEEIDLLADTCGHPREVGWDLDDDGVFDDAVGARVQWRPDAYGLLPVAVEVRSGATAAVSRAEIEVLAPPAP